MHCENTMLLSNITILKDDYLLNSINVATGLSKPAAIRPITSNVGFLTPRSIPLT